MSVDASFLTALDYEPDQFQIEAFEAFDAGSHVIVAAPTGSGKTLVASYAVHRALGAGGRVFYTTPIKALSNQKYHDLAADHGVDNVGLLTGDNVINPDAAVVVMTTEVLRNMLYAGRDLGRVQAVVLDEVHYLQDSYRGPVWEEVIIHLPRTIQLVCLSATVSNADELAAWMQTVRGDTELVVETRRPVELENRYLVAEKKGPKLHLIRTLVGGKSNNKGHRFDPQVRRKGQRGSGQKGRRSSPIAYRTPGRTDVVRILREQDMLPAIHFIFSRGACTDAAREVVDRGMVLTTDIERQRIAELVGERSAALSGRDKRVLEFDRFVQGLEAGVAAHHAGMVPLMKELVEACFVEGLVKMVFATETLALGINMPARTVVIDKLTKWTGAAHEFLTPAQYTQLTGRAGRRGIDTRGEAIVLWSPWVRFDQVAQLAGSRQFVLSSAFRPTYNMAANLVRRYPPDEARHLLNLSFAQYRADAGIVAAEQRIESLRRRREKIHNQLAKEFGPVDELAAALSVESTLETGDVLNDERLREDIAFALSRVDRGDILELDGPSLPAPVVTLSVAYRKGGRVKVQVADEELAVHEVTAADLDAVPIVIGRVELPEPYLPASMTFIHDTVERMKRAPLLSQKRRLALGPSGHVRLASDVPPAARRGLRRLAKLDEQIADAHRSARDDADSLSAQFDAVIDLLADRGHLEGWRLTDSGERLARLYHESDLLVVEALHDGLFDGLRPAELAGLVSCVVYEERGGLDAPEAWFPSGDLRRRFVELNKLHKELHRRERRGGLPETRQPDPGFVAVAHAWASGVPLEETLSDDELTAGDFVRTIKLLNDLLRQIAILAPVPATQTAARDAGDAINRDLVAQSGLLG